MTTTKKRGQRGNLAEGNVERRGMVSACDEAKCVAPSRFGLYQLVPVEGLRLPGRF